MFHFYGNCLVFAPLLFTVSESVSTRVRTWDCLYSLIQSDRSFSSALRLRVLLFTFYKLPKYFPLPRDKCDSSEIKTFRVFGGACFAARPHGLVGLFVYNPELSHPSSPKCKKDSQITFFPHMALLRQKPPSSQSVPPSAPCGLAENSLLLFCSTHREPTFKEESRISPRETH